MDQKKAPGLDQILMEDHDKIDVLIKRLLSETCCLAGQELEQMKEVFQSAKSRLLKHIHFEETEVFPCFEQKSGELAYMGPTAIMKVEHEQIKAFLGSAEKALHSGLANLFRSELHKLLQTLMEHNGKEEFVLYPRTVHLIGEQMTQELGQRALKELA